MKTLNIIIVIVSDTRTTATDKSGKMLKKLISKAGHNVIKKVIVPDDIYQIRHVVSMYIAEKKIDVNKEVSKLAFKKTKNIKFTNKEADIKNSDFFIITVPTPINNKKLPDLESIKIASKIVGNQIKKNSGLEHFRSTAMLNIPKI